MPYLLDVQSDLLQGLDTRIVVPLRRLDRFAAVSLPANLTPTFKVEGVECLLETPVASLASSQFEITVALGFLFYGF